MSSSRFPGKVLAPFRGDPIVLHVVRAVQQELGSDAVVVATSVQPSDDPLEAYLDRVDVPVFRGSLDDVLGRFQACLDAYPCDWVLRICADSPLLDPAVIRLALDAAGDDVDVVTTTAPRTFADGQNVELVREAVLRGLGGPELTAEDREHVTRFLYRHPERFRIRNLESGDPALSGRSVVVDTVEDLKRLEEELLTRLGVAVVGLGVGEAHARAYLASGECELRALYDPDEERAQRLAAELGAGRVARAYEDLLDDPAVHLVSLASPDDAHFGQALAALHAGKHVFAEKPLCRSQDELAALQKARLAHPGLHLGSNLVLRAAPFYCWLREQVAGGALGTVYAFDGDYLYGRLHKLTDGWRTDVEGYSVLLGGGIHLVDQLLRITGQRPRAVTAVGNRISTRGTAFGYPDFVAATYEFESGLVGRITANFGCVQPHQHVVRVFGTEATVTYDDQGPRLHESRDPSLAPARLDLAALPPDKGVLVPGFVRAILDGAEPTPEAEQEFALIAACAAADRALEERRRVDIEYCS